MEKLNEVSADYEDEMFKFCEEVYGNSLCALHYGATKEDLLAQIELAFEVHEDSLLKGSWCISPKN